MVALEKEILPQLEKLHPAIPPAERRIHALLAARAASKSMYGKYAVDPPEVLIIAENFPALYGSPGCYRLGSQPGITP